MEVLKRFEAVDTVANHSADKSKNDYYAQKKVFQINIFLISKNKIILTNLK